MGMDVGRRKGAIAAINVTPMADVMIVLLIIFMVTLPVITSERVHLPEAAQAREQKDDKSLVLELDEGGGLAVDHHPALPRAAALGEVKELAGADPLRPIVIKADRAISYTIVSEVLDACREAGAETVSLATSTAPREEAH
jgi:biopolymer transport protein ExbD